jgi:hypothetical protein
VAVELRELLLDIRREQPAASVPTILLARATKRWAPGPRHRQGRNGAASVP